MPDDSNSSRLMFVRTRPLAAKEQTRKGILVLALLLFGTVWLLLLDTRALAVPDEARYAEMAREMLVSGDFVTPRLNEIKYFEKPPLQVWATALAFRTFGLGAWQARLWTGLTGLASVLLVGWTGSRLFGARAGLLAAVVLGSSWAWGLSGHINSLDMGLAAMMTLALCAFLMARNSARPLQRRNWMLACWAGMAMALLSKGLVGVVLPAAVLLLDSLLRRDWQSWRQLHAGPGLALFLLLAAPWFILVARANPEFASFFLLHEHVERFLTTVHRRPGPWYYYFPILLLGIFPWVGVLFQALKSSLRQAAAERNIGLLLLWCGFIFLFFSSSGSKLPGYILPLFPALALLLGRYLDRNPARGAAAAATLFSFCSVLLLNGARAMPLAASNAYELPLFRAYAAWVTAAGGLGLAAGLLALWLTRSDKVLALLVLACGGFLSGQALLAGHDRFGRYQSGLQHLPAIAAELGPEPGNIPIYAVGLYEQALPFYLRHPLLLVAHPDELEFGLRQEPQRWIPEVSEFAARWRQAQANGDKAMALMRPEMFQRLEQDGLSMRVIGRDPRRVIVASD